jgi:hypothetical protein
MPQYTESVEIDSAAAQVWEGLATPESVSEGYLETRLRSPDYPNPDSRNDHVYRTRIREDVAARAIPLQPAKAARGGPEGQDVLPSRALLPQLLTEASVSRSSVDTLGARPLQ